MLFLLDNGYPDDYGLGLMPSVWLSKRKNKNGNNYMVRWETSPKGEDGKRLRDAGGKALRIPGSESCGPSKTYAEKRKLEILEDLYAGKTIKPRVKFIMAPDFCEDYLANSEKTKAENTLKNFERPALRHFAVWFGKKPLAAVTKETLFEWRDELLGEKLSHNTVRMRLRDLSTALGYAMEHGYIENNPFGIVKKNSLFPQAVDVSRYITKDEVGKLLPALPLHVAKAFYFVLHTGLRHGELLNLDWKMIHRPAQGPWIIDVTRASAHGLQGGHQTKTRQAREVEIPDQARAPEVLGEPQAAGAVFTWRTRDVIESALRKAAESLKMGRVRAHDGRHTWATDFMFKTGNVFELMYRGGWKSMVSARVYQHIRKRGEPDEYKPFSRYFRTNTEIRVVGNG